MDMKVSMRTESPINSLKTNKKPANADGKKAQPLKVDDKVDVGKSKESDETSFLGKCKKFIEKNITGEGTLSKGDQKKAWGYNNYHNNHARFAAIGATAGGAAGAGIGLIAGYEEMRSDQVDLQTKNIPVKDPKLTGFTHWARETGYYTSELRGYDAEGNAQYEQVWHSTGYDHDFSPKIEYDRVGSYDKPVYEHTNTMHPIKSGLLGLFGGTVIGGLGGLLVSVIHKAITNRG